MTRSVVGAEAAAGALAVVVVDDEVDVVACFEAGDVFAGAVVVGLEVDVLGMEVDVDVDVDAGTDVVVVTASDGLPVEGGVCAWAAAGVTRGATSDSTTATDISRAVAAPERGRPTVCTCSEARRSCLSARISYPPVARPHRPCNATVARASEERLKKRPLGLKICLRLRAELPIRQGSGEGRLKTGPTDVAGAQRFAAPGREIEACPGRRDSS